MNRTNVLFLVLLAALLLLTASIFYRAGRESLAPSLSRTSVQEVAAVGDEIAAEFKIINPFEERREYTYLLFLNGEKRYERKVAVDPKSEFTFGGHYKALEPGIATVTAMVYEGDKEKLVKNMTYFVTVKPR